MTTQSLPTEIQELIDRLSVLVAQCEGELASLQKARDNWEAQRGAALDRIKSLKLKYAKPILTVWPPEEAK